MYWLKMVYIKYIYCVDIYIYIYLCLLMHIQGPDMPHFAMQQTETNS